MVVVVVRSTSSSVYPYPESLSVDVPAHCNRSLRRDRERLTSACMIDAMVQKVSTQAKVHEYFSISIYIDREERRLVIMINFN